MIYDLESIKKIVARLILIDIGSIDFLYKYPFAGYILFYKDLKDLDFEGIKEFNLYNRKVYLEKFGVNLIRSIDQEGGVVFRFDFEDYPAICSQWVINNESDCFNLAYFNGVILKLGGFNLNFSPVLDINSNVDNPIIGVRSFGNNYEKVLNLSKVFIEGYKRSGILCCGKHFPGHGSTSVDSHLSLPKTRVNIDELNVFLNNLENLDSIMTAHIVYEDIDVFPATLSKKVLELIYQRDYKGVIFSDALNMLALSGFEFDKLLIKALEAGVDILLVFGEDDKKEQAINIISNYALRNNYFLEILVSKYHKVNNFINTINEGIDESIFRNYEKLRFWFYNEFNFSPFLVGDIDKFRLNLRDSINFVFANSYLNEIGVVDKIKKFINKGEVYFVNLDEFVREKKKFFLDKVNGGKSVNLFYVPIYKDLNFIDFVNSLREKGLRDINLITFANPFFDNLKVDVRMDIFGFSNIHLKKLNMIF